MWLADRPAVSVDFELPLVDPGGTVRLGPCRTDAKVALVFGSYT